MKTRMLVSILILVLAVMVLVGNYATGQDTGKVPVELLYGTWVNPDRVIFKSCGLEYKKSVSYGLKFHNKKQTV